MRRRAIAAVAVVVAVATWGVVAFFTDDGVPGVGELPTDVSSASASSRLGACDEPYEADVPFDGFLADAERWLEVIDVGPLPEPLSQERRVDFSPTVQPVLAGAERTGRASAVGINIDGSKIPGIEWATRANGRAFVALASEGRVRESAILALIQHPDGEFFFAGECQERFLTGPLRSAWARGTTTR